MSEVGVIPEEWEVKTFEDIADKNVKWSMTGGPFGSNLKASEYTSDGVRIVQLQNIGDGIFNDEYKIYTSTEKANELLSCNIYPNEIILSKMGDPVARACFIPNKGKRFLMSSDGIRLVVDERRFAKKFVHDYINSIYFRKRASDASIGSTRLRIGLQDLKKLLVIAPPLPEQQAIASALTDVDALIAALEQLIAKKRNIKQGAMQQLLTGEKRLPGFGGKWEVKSFGETFKFLQTGNNSRSDLSEYGEIKNIHYGDIHTKWKSFLDCSKDIIPSIDKDKVKNLPLLEEGDLVMADASEDYNGLGVSVEVKNIKNEKVVAGLHTLLLRGDKTIVADGFKGYIQSIKTVQDSLKRISTGISVYSISKNNLKSILIPLPSLPEQQAIAQILTDMDAEIEALEQKQAKYKAIKQGMMQELLTGKTRLV